MKAGLFSPLLVLLILTMIVKAFLLFGRVQEQTTYATDTHASSVLVDTAYVKGAGYDKNHANKNLYNSSVASVSRSSGVASSIIISSAEAATPSKPDSGNVTTSSDMRKKEPTIKSRPSNEEKTLEDIKNTATELEGSKSQAPVKTVDSVNNLSRSEINLLKELSKRRQKLDDDRKELTSREQVLKATEDKIDQKVAEMKKLQDNLEALMKQYDQKEHSKIMSLVKIYETMKPKDAANIFNELEMPILLRVISNMKEVKVAPIIASMNPDKARQLSIELAKQKPIN